MKARIKLKNLPKKDKDNLKEGALLFTGLAGGVGIFSVFGSGLFTKEDLSHLKEVETLELEDSFLQAKMEIPAPENLPEDLDESYIEVETSMEVEDLSEFTFSEAFLGARAEYGPGGLFEYKGSTYTTYYKEELEALTDHEVEVVAAQLNEATDLDSWQVVDKETTDVPPVEEDVYQASSENEKDETGVSDEVVETEIDRAEVDQVSDSFSEVHDLDRVEVNHSDFEDAFFIDNTAIAESSSEAQTGSNEGKNDLSELDFSDDEFGTEVTEASDASSIGNYTNVELSDFSDEAFSDLTELPISSNGVEQVVLVADVDYEVFQDSEFDSMLEITDPSTSAERALIASSEVDLKDFEDAAFGNLLESADDTPDAIEYQDVIVDAGLFNDPEFDSYHETLEKDVASIDASDSEVINIDDEVTFTFGESSETLVDVPSSEIEVLPNVTNVSESNINEEAGLEQEITSSEYLEDFENEEDNFDDSIFDDPDF